MEELRVKAAKLQKDCLAAQEKTDRCKEQVDALQAELTATASEQITAANDKVRAEAEQKRLEAAAAQLETARSNGQQQIDALQAAMTESRGKAEEAASLQARLTAKIDLLTAEMNRIAEGDDNFVVQQTELSQKLSAKRLEQVTRQKDAELAYSQIAALQQRAQDAAARRATMEESLGHWHSAARAAGQKLQPSGRQSPTARPRSPKKKRQSGKPRNSGWNASRLKQRH